MNSTKSQKRNLRRKRNKQFLKKQHILDGNVQKEHVQKEPILEEPVQKEPILERNVQKEHILDGIIEPPLISSLPLDSIIRYLLVAYHIPIPSGNLILLDTPGITISINNYFMGQISFEELIYIHENLLVTGYIHVGSLIAIYLVCGFNLVELIPSNLSDQAVANLQMDKWLLSLIDQPNRYQEMCHSLTRLRTTCHLEDRLYELPFHDTIFIGDTRGGFYYPIYYLISSLIGSLSTYQTNHPTLYQFTRILDIIRDMIEINYT